MNNDCKDMIVNSFGFPVVHVKALYKCLIQHKYLRWTMNYIFFTIILLTASWTEINR